MAQRLCLITGGNTGLGFEVARQLLRAGNNVVVASRTEEGGRVAVEALQREATGGCEVSLLQCDLASLASVRAAAAAFTQRWHRLDVLVCNAATIPATHTTTQDGFESAYQTNHLGHFLLTHLLMPPLLASDSGRVVVVSSQLHAGVGATGSGGAGSGSSGSGSSSSSNNNSSSGNSAVKGSGGSGGGATTTVPASPDFLHSYTPGSAGAPPYQPMAVYGLTKLCNIWFVRHLATQLPPRVVCNAVSPGFVPTTQLSRYVSASRGALGAALGRFAMNFIMPWAPFSVTLQEGGRRIAALATGNAEGRVSGRYFSKGKEADVSAPAADPVLAARLWQLSCDAVGVPPDAYVPSVPAAPGEQQPPAVQGSQAS